MNTTGLTPGLRGGLLLVASAALIAGCGGTQEPPVAAPQPAATSKANPFVQKKASAVGEPARVKIPAIGVDAPLVELGLKSDGAMETPASGKAGWYTEGPRPGEKGPAVIAAHVDGKTGPDVFYRLKELKRGAKIVVTDKAGKTHAFAVERKPLKTAKTELPAKQIWGATDGPALRLITCGGDFDKASGHYLSNWTIFAKAV